jgi:hypothetical protein
MKKPRSPIGDRGSGWLRGRADVLVMSGDGEVELRSPLAPAERIAFAGDEVVVAGTAAPGVHDLGRGPVTVDAQSAFVVSFDP